MPKPFSDSEKEFIRKKLLTAGKEHFSQYGLKKTSIEELTRSAGISKAGFYIFFESKEELFMDVVEEAEQEYREFILNEIRQPGISARIRLKKVLQQALSMWRTIPVLRDFSDMDMEELSLRISEKKIAEHMASDRQFMQQFLNKCRENNIPIVIEVDKIDGLIYTLLFTSMQDNQISREVMPEAINTLIELVAAYCLGEITLSV